MVSVSDLMIQNSGWSETLPLSHLYVEFRGGPACGPDGDYLMEFYAKDPEPNNILGEDVEGVQVVIDQITI